MQIRKLWTPAALFMTWTMTISCLLVSTRPVQAQVGPAATLTVGLVLDHLMDQLQQAIEAARNAGLTVEIEAGQQAAITIQNAQNAYTDSLKKTFDDHLNPTIKSTIDQMTSMVNDISSNTFGNLDALTARAQQIVNSLPFRKHEPQLTQVFPRFVVPSQQLYPVAVRFQGNFEYASRQGFTPIFTANYHKYTVSANTTQSLTFLVPITEFFASATSADPRKYSYAEGTLSVPWQTSVLGIFGHRHQDTYKVILGVLPASPGKIQVIHTTSRTERHTRSYRTTDYYQTSGSDGQNNDHADIPYSVSPDVGWFVIKGSSSINTGSPNEGDKSITFASDDGNQVVYRVTTIHHGMIGTSGKIRFSISFDEYQDVSTSDSATEAVDLKWGDSKSLNYAPGSWKVIYDGFDGSHAEFAGADLSNPFLKVKDQTGSLILTTADPKNLVWP